jgi:hypothetical protein
VLDHPVGRSGVIKYNRVRRERLVVRINVRDEANQNFERIVDVSSNNQPGVTIVIRFGIGISVRVSIRVGITG